jgi:hypothetical protein
MKLISHFCFLFLKPVPDNCTGTLCCGSASFWCRSGSGFPFRCRSGSGSGSYPKFYTYLKIRNYFGLLFSSASSHGFIFLVSVIDFNILDIILKSGKNYSLTQNQVEMNTGIRFRMPIRSDPDVQHCRYLRLTCFVLQKGRLSWSRFKNKPYPPSMNVIRQYRIFYLL